MALIGSWTGRDRSEVVWRVDHRDDAGHPAWRVWRVVAPEDRHGEFYGPFLTWGEACGLLREKADELTCGDLHGERPAVEMEGRPVKDVDAQV